MIEIGSIIAALTLLCAFVLFFLFKREKLIYQSQVCKQNSKSFYFASLLFPKKLRKKVHIFYAFARACDDLIDEVSTKGQQNKNIIMLDEIVRIFEEGKKTNDLLFDIITKNHEAFIPVAHDKELNVTKESSEPLEICNFSKILLDFSDLVKDVKLQPWVLKLLLEGFKHDTQFSHVLHEEQLLNYCLGVASSIGLSCCYIFGVTSEKAQIAASSLGIAMQLTNISRDILADADLGRTYIPTTWFKAINIQPDDFILLSESEKAAYIKPLALNLISMAEVYYKQGWLGLKYLPLRIKFAVAAAALIYRKIGLKIKRLLTDNKAYPRRCFTTKTEKIFIGITASVFVAVGKVPSFLIKEKGFKNKTKEVLDAFKTDFVFANEEK